MVKKEILEAAPDNQLIRNTFIKADKLLDSYKNPICSVSGGSDSDTMLDLIEKVRNGRPVKYVFYDTGIEYEATKRHLKYLEEKYGIEIERLRAVKPVPLGCRDYGIPFMSKRNSMYISRLQKHGFKWEDEPFDELIKRYPKCQSALRWWCNEWGEKSSFNIDRNKALKAFMIQNPPDFPISDMCCEGAKKKTAKLIDQKYDCCLKIIGERRAEGGIRALRHHSCFDPVAEDSIPTYRPLFFWNDADKKQYKEHYGLVYSDCYEKWNMTRTGCAGCPFGSRFENELELIQQYEPRLYQAINNIFGKSYEYTRRYREFKNKKE